MRISAIQTKQAVTYDISNPGNIDLEACKGLAQEEMDRGFALMKDAADAGADLLVTIEVFNADINPDDPRYHFPDTVEPIDGQTIRRFSSFASNHKVHIVAGLYTSREGRAYNSAVLFGTDGSIVGIFDKVHLPAGEERQITPGRDFPVFQTDHGVLGMLVCWDLQFPEAARELALAGADLIVCPTWGWEKRYGLCRAYENGLTVVAAMGVPASGEIWDFCDPSCIVDNMGEVLAEGSRRDRCVVSAEVDIRKEPVPQYGSGAITGWDTMRRIRMSQRRPETYRHVVSPNPPVFDRWNGNGSEKSM